MEMKYEKPRKNKIWLRGDIFCSSQAQRFRLFLYVLFFSVQRGVHYVIGAASYLIVAFSKKYPQRRSMPAQRDRKKGSSLCPYVPM